MVSTELSLNKRKWSTAFPRQTQMMLWKSGILLWRNKRGLIIQLLSPFILVALLKFMEFAIQTNRRWGTEFTVIRHYDPENIESIPRCVIGPHDDMCITIAYAPTNLTIANEIVERIRQANDIPKREVKGFASEIELDNYLYDHPNRTQGAYIFSETTDPATSLRRIDFIIQVNKTDNRIHGKRIRHIPYVYLPMQVSIHREIMRYATNNSDLAFSARTINYPHPELNTVNIIGTSGPSFFLGALIFNFVICLSHIVYEKESKLRESMKLMGLYDSAYWLSWFIINAVSSTLIVFILIASGAIFQFDFFLKNDFGTYFILLWLFSLTLIPLAFIISAFIRLQRQATTIGFLIFLIGFALQIIAAIVIENEDDTIIIGIFCLFSPTLLAKGMYDLGTFSDAEADTGLRWEDRADYTSKLPLEDMYKWLIFDFFLYILLALYFDNVIPREYGTRQPVLFFLRPSYWTGKRRRPHIERYTATTLPAVPANQDEDVTAEAVRVMTDNLPATTAVKIRNLRKHFKGGNAEGGCCCCCCQCRAKPFKAVRGLWLSIHEDELFCLLGPNGAGKTTTISILTGLLAPTSGDAELFGYSITSDMNSIRHFLGVCPQFEVLWPELSAEEHLRIFAVLKGVATDRIGSEVEERLAQVALGDVRRRPTSAYSGGMRRRLSVAIAFIGDPKIVFLDEPTTGMDPISRRQVWTIIEKAKKGRVIVLTTHSMEEADILGDRIAIMARGQLQCLGTPIRLKNKFGAGYRVTISGEEGSLPKIRAFFTERLRDVTIDVGVGSNFVINIPRSNINALPRFFEELDAHRRELGVHDMDIGLATLEEVFLNIAEAAEAKEAAEA